MPELWIPFGPVETLVTIQAESLGTVVEPRLDAGDTIQESHAGLMEGASSLFVCDNALPTLELLKELAPGISSAQAVKVFSAAPKRAEFGIPELKGKIFTLPPPIPPGDGQITFAQELTGGEKKVFIATGRPDPLFGLIDAKVQTCLNWVANSHAEAAQQRKEMEPSPFLKTASYSTIEALLGQVPGGHYATVVPRGGKLRSVMVDAPFDAVKGGFLAAAAQPAKGMVVGAGGAGYDESLSAAIRGVWGALPGLRKSGSLLLIAECAEGLGSPALEMLATGRLVGDSDRRKGSYVEGLEEISYLNRLKEDYDVLLLSALPEVFAKSKLGLSTARGSGEGVGRLLNKVGRSGKINVVARAPECRISSA